MPRVVIFTATDVTTLCGFSAGFDHPLVAPTWQAVVERTSSLYVSALADSTKAKYSAHASYWARFCVLFGFRSVMFCPTEEVFCHFVSWLSLTNSHASVRTTLSGVRSFLAERGVAASSDAWHKLHRVLKGLKRAKGSAPDRKKPISPDDLRAFKARMTNTTFATALWACMLVTWWGMLRKSNTTVGYKHPMDTSAAIQAADVRVLRDEWALELRIRKSKTNQFKERVHVIVLQGCEGHPLDPVRAWIDHACASAPTCTEPAFSYTEGGTRSAVSHTQLVSATKLLFAAGGGSMSDVSGHSYRRGGATYAFLSGVPDILIQRQGDWASMAYRMYIDLSTHALRQATRTMFDRLRSGVIDQGSAFAVAVEPLGHVAASSARLDSFCD